MKQSLDFDCPLFTQSMIKLKNEEAYDLLVEGKMIS